MDDYPVRVAAAMLVVRSADEAGVRAEADALSQFHLRRRGTSKHAPVGGG